MKLELKPDIEAALVAQAQARGLSLEAYVDEVLERAATTKSARPADRKSLAQLFAESPLKGLDLKFERDQDLSSYERVPSGYERTLRAYPAPVRFRG